MISLDSKRDCCGCTACESICGVGAITMGTDKEGFLYPQIDLSRCVNCDLCEKVCPVIYRDSTSIQQSERSIFALCHKDLNRRKLSSSGGVFSAVIEFCISNGGVVYGAVYNNSFEVVHKVFCDEDSAKAIRGSKYVQSNIHGVYKEIQSHLNQGKMVVFSGTPCQVEGLVCFLRKPYDNLITVDLLCHGVPSPKIFREYVKIVQKYSFGRLSRIYMKDKTFGWENSMLRLHFSTGRTEINSILSTLWHKIFYSHTVNRPICAKCRWTNLHRPGDISIGDYWGIDKIHHNFQTNDGVSLLLVNTDKGHELWRKIKGEFDFIESNEEDCLQPVLCNPTEEAKDRVDFWKQYETVGFEKSVSYRYGCSRKAFILNMLKQYMRFIRIKMSSKMK